MPEPDTQADLALLREAALEAGKIATRYFRRDPRQWDKPGAGPVSEADLAVDKFLTETLRKARPDYGWLSEESPDNPDRLSQDTVFIVDPIDGTRSFLEGSRSWAHSLAVVHKGVAVAGVVHLPLRDFTYAATHGGGATLNGDTLQASTRPEMQGAKVLANKWSLAPQYWQGDLPPIERHYRPSLAYRLGLVAQGRFDGMLVFRDTWEWDIAAGALIASEAGAAVTDRFGKPLSFNRPRPVSEGLFAAGSRVHEGLIARVA